MLIINELKKIPVLERVKILNNINNKLEKLSTNERIDWSIQNLPKNFILSSSFGIQSIVSLHLLTIKIPKIPIILIDTGYMFPETYKFIDQLTDELNLNLKIFRSKQSSAWQESKYGKLWEKGIKGIKKYNYINKIEPMQYALKYLSVNTWFAGLRNSQSKSREKLKILSIKNEIFKFLPIIDWSNQKVYRYIKKNKLKLHPLFYKGYLSIGDIHTTNKWKPGKKIEDTRFFGLKRECGLHE